MIRCLNCSSIFLLPGYEQAHYDAHVPFCENKLKATRLKKALHKKSKPEENAKRVLPKKPRRKKNDLVETTDILVD